MLRGALRSVTSQTRHSNLRAMCKSARNGATFAGQRRAEMLFLHDAHPGIATGRGGNTDLSVPIV